MASHVINPNTGRLISVTGDQYRKLVKLGVLSSGAQPPAPQLQETPRHTKASHQENDEPDEEDEEELHEEPRQVQTQKEVPKQRSVKQSPKEEIHQPIVNEYQFNDSDFDDD